MSTKKKAPKDENCPMKGIEKDRDTECACWPKLDSKFPNMMVLKLCREDPPHPCDPKVPCKVCVEGRCPSPKICRHRLKNPVPGWQTKCKSGKWLSVAICNEDPPHPCDPPKPCITGKSQPIKCTKPSLCKQRVKHLPPKDLRCHPDPDDFYSRELCENLKLLKEEIKYKPKPRCPPRLYLDPHEQTVKPGKFIKTESDPDAWKYSKTLCKYRDLLKTPLCPRKPSYKCKPKLYMDPFEEEEEQRRKKSCQPDKDPCFEPWV